MYTEDGSFIYDDYGNELPSRFIRPVVYFIEAVGLDLVKIGYSEELIRRFKEIRTSCPVPVRLIGFLDGNRAAEAALHHQYAKYRAEGEWFRISQAAMDQLRTSMDRGTGWGVYQDFRDTCEGNRELIRWRPKPKEIESFDDVYADLMEEVAEEFVNV